MNKLKELRKKKGLTQKEMAIKLNIAHSTYNSYETGAINPDYKMLITLADFFNTSIDELVERKSEIINLNYLDETRKNLITEILEMDDNAVDRLDAFYQGLKQADKDRKEIIERLKKGKNE